MIKCCCGAPDCDISIHLDTDDRYIYLWTCSPEGREFHILLDRKATLELINELVEALLYLEGDNEPQTQVD